MTRAPWQRKSVAEGTPHNPVSAATDFSRSGHSACEGGVKPARGFVIPVRGTRSGDCANNIINDIIFDVGKQRRLGMRHLRAALRRRLEILSATDGHVTTGAVLRT